MAVDNKQKFQYRTNEAIRVKEVRLVGDNVEQGVYTIHDYNFKLKHAKGFLSEGSKVKAYVFFRGRSILFKDQGEVLLLRFANDLEDYGRVESMPVLEGKRMTIMIAPKKAPSSAPKKDKATKSETEEVEELSSED